MNGTEKTYRLATVECKSCGHTIDRYVEHIPGIPIPIEGLALSQIETDDDYRCDKCNSKDLIIWGKSE